MAGLEDQVTPHPQTSHGGRLAETPWSDRVNQPLHCCDLQPGSMTVPTRSRVSVVDDAPARRGTSGASGAWAPTCAVCPTAPCGPTRTSSRHGSSPKASVRHGGRQSASTRSRNARLGRRGPSRTSCGGRSAETASRSRSRMPVRQRATGSSSGRPPGPVSSSAPGRVCRSSHRVPTSRSSSGRSGTSPRCGRTSLHAPVTRTWRTCPDGFRSSGTTGRPNRRTACGLTSTRCSSLRGPSAG